MNHEVKHQFVRAALLFRKMDMNGPPGGISYGEMVVMGQVKALRPQSCLNMAELAGQLCVSRPAVSQMLRSLEKKGYIVRQPDPADRRRITVVSTSEGNRALRRTQQQYDADFNRFLDAVTLDELNTLIRLMNRLTSAYNKLSHSQEPEKEEGENP